MYNFHGGFHLIVYIGYCITEFHVNRVTSSGTKQQSETKTQVIDMSSENRTFNLMSGLKIQIITELVSW